MGWYLYSCKCKAIDRLPGREKYNKSGKKEGRGVASLNPRLVDI